jgi:putative ABC transport system ATP-binding protein
MNRIVLEAGHVGLDYSNGRLTHVLRGIDLVLLKGDYVGVMGPSGSGKSSLLYVLAGLRQPTYGEVRFLGRPWPPRISRSADVRRRSVGFVFQEPRLVSHLTIGENIQVQSADGNVTHIVQLARRLGIANLLDELPERLSNGERQRASVARALVNEPVLLLADEPTASLDTENGLSVMSLLADTRGHAAVLVCSHDPRMLTSISRVYQIIDGVLAPPAGGVGPEEDRGGTGRQ